jgi:hypothetical protein
MLFNQLKPMLCAVTMPARNTGTNTLAVTTRSLMQFKTICIKLFMFLTLVMCTSTVTLAASKVNGHQLTKDTLSLQNLERERAALIQDFLSLTLDIQQRQQQLVKRQRQLSDMERMVMRDERLLSSGSPFVKQAFSQYELTFLVHAGAENKQSASEHWLKSINVSNDAILNTKTGFRK